jgi:hypothetical protein
MRNKLIKQGLIITTTFVTLYLLLLFLADRWMNVGAMGSLPQRCILQFPKWIGCATANHESLAGALVGATGTIFAGWLAWRAAVYTVLNQRRPQIQALAIVISELSPFLLLYVEVWRIIDRAAFESPAIQENGVHLIQTIAPQQEAIDRLSSYVEKYHPVLEPHRSRALSDVIESLARVVRATEREVTKGQNKLWLLSIRTQLTFFESQVRALDVSAAKPFEKCVKAPIDIRPDADHIRGLVDEFIKRGTIS